MADHRSRPSTSCDEPKLYTVTAKNVVRELVEKMCGMKTNIRKSVLTNTIKDINLSKFVNFESAHRAPVHSMDFEKNGRYLVTGDKAGDLIIYDTRNFSGEKGYQCKVKEHVCVGNPFQVNDSLSRLSPYVRPAISVESVQWYPFDAGMIFTGGMDRKVRGWDTCCMLSRQVWDFSHKIFQIHVSSTDTRSPLIAVASGAAEVKLVDLVTNHPTQELRGHTNCVFCCRWSPTNPNLLATGGYDCTVRLWDVRSSRSCLAVLDKTNTAKRSRKRDMIESHNGSVNGLQFTPDGRILISTGSDNRVRCWDLHTLKNTDVKMGHVNIRQGRTIEFSICGSNNQHFCFIPDECKISVYHVESGLKVKSLVGHYNHVNCCYFHNDRMELYSGGQDRYVLCFAKGDEDVAKEINLKKMLAERRPDGGGDWEALYY